MKILQAFDFLSLPHGGGTVDIVYKLSKALSNRGHAVTICTSDHEIDYNYLSGLGKVGLKIYHSYFNKYGFYVVPGLTDMDVRGYDIIHLHSYRSIQNIILVPNAVEKRIPYIIDAHGSTMPRAGRKKLLLDIYDYTVGKSIIENASILIAETDVGVQEWVNLGARLDCIRVQHPLIDTTEFSQLPERGLFRKLYNINDSPIILFLGRIHIIKGIDTLVRAVQHIISEENIDIQLVIAGKDDGYEDTIRSIVLDTGLSPDRVHFTGYINGVHKKAALVDASVLVQPSYYEAGARPSLESILCGTPVIVSRNTGAGRAIASFGGGLLFDAGSVKELADAIRNTLSNSKDAKLRTNKAREYIIENLSSDNSIISYENLYQEAMR